MKAVLEGRVCDAMSGTPKVVSAATKIQEVASLFSEHSISSAPVVDESGRCIGLITSTDLIRFQSLTESAVARIDHGMTFEIQPTHHDGQMQVVAHPFDEVQRHMATAIQSISADHSLVEAANFMSSQHVHHLVVLDDSERVIGTLSSLDLLAKLETLTEGNP